MSTYKKNVLFILASLLFAFLSVPVFVWLVDPFHLYHRDTWLNRGIWPTGGSRSLANGTVLHSVHTVNNVDGILLGGCRSEGFITSDLKRAVKSKKLFVHLYTTGIDLNRTHLSMLLEALKIQNIDHVVLLRPPAVFSLEYRPFFYFVTRNVLCF